MQPAYRQNSPIKDMFNERPPHDNAAIDDFAICVIAVGNIYTLLMYMSQIHVIAEKCNDKAHIQ